MATHSSPHQTSGIGQINPTMPSTHQENLQDCLKMLDEHIKRLQERVVRAEQLTDYLCGQRPNSGDPGVPQTVPIGYVGELSDRLRTLGKLISVLAEEQGRVESLTIG